MTISQICQTSPGRMTVTFEDGTEVKSTLAVTTDLMLFNGKELDDCGLENLKTASVRSLTLERSIEYLSRRMLSSKELFDKLIGKGIDDDTAQYCIDKLTELGILNDLYYASSLARHYVSRGYGAGKIKSELFRRGISKEYFDQVLSGIEKNDAKINKIISQKLKDPSDKTQVKKVCDCLYRRGFSWDEIKQSLRDYVDEIEEL